MAKRMNAQIEGLSVANQNASDGVSIIEIADGAMKLCIRDSILPSLILTYQWVLWYTESEKSGVVYPGE